MNKLDNNLLSIICILIGMSIFSIQDVLIRILSDDVSTLQILFTRSIVGSLLLIAYLKIQNIKINFSTSYPLLTIFRGIIFLFGFALFYVGLANLSFAICTSLFFTAPFFVTILGVCNNNFSEFSTTLEKYVPPCNGRGVNKLILSKS